MRLARLIESAPLSVLADIRLLPQCNVSVRVRDKVRTLGSEGVRAAVARESGKVARLVVRASGTEPVVRIFAEAETARAASAAAEGVRRAVLSEEE